MSTPLPEAFCARMRHQLGGEYSAFGGALESSPVRGLRVNPLRNPASEIRFWQTLPSIPWEENGFFLPTDSEAGTSVAHEAGAFYLQEPAAMLPARVLNPQPGERVLDLCAAPGGKSTQMGIALGGEGLLVSNEPVPNRAAILSRNIERMGISNALVVSAWPDQLARQWPGVFDAVLVDAPCSGEGMFRREPASRGEWSPEQAAGCVKRQREILDAAARLLRPGGRMVYSTCTWNPAENEENVHWFLENHPDFGLESFQLPGVEGASGMFTCYPHRTPGEGQFVANLRKAGESGGANPGAWASRGDVPNHRSGEERRKPTAGKNRAGEQSSFAPTPQEINAFRKALPSAPEPTGLLGHTLISAPSLPPLAGIKVLRAGLHLGEVRGAVVQPDHALAMSGYAEHLPHVELTDAEAERFLAGETIPGEAAGWTICTWRGLPLGWGKGSDGMIKNHYPKGLRNGRIHAECKEEV